MIPGGLAVLLEILLSSFLFFMIQTLLLDMTEMVIAGCLLVLFCFKESPCCFCRDYTIVY